MNPWVWNLLPFVLVLPALYVAWVVDRATKRPGAVRFAESALPARLRGGRAQGLAAKLHALGFVDIGGYRAHFGRFFAPAHRTLFHPDTRVYADVLSVAGKVKVLFTVERDDGALAHAGQDTSAGTYGPLVIRAFRGTLEERLARLDATLASAPAPTRFAPPTTRPGTITDRLRLEHRFWVLRYGDPSEEHELRPAEPASEPTPGGGAALSFVGSVASSTPRRTLALALALALLACLYGAWTAIAPAAWMPPTYAVLYPLSVPMLLFMVSPFFGRLRSAKVRLEDGRVRVEPRGRRPIDVRVDAIDGVLVGEEVLAFVADGRHVVIDAAPDDIAHFAAALPRSVPRGLRIADAPLTSGLLAAGGGLALLYAAKAGLAAAALAAGWLGLAVLVCLAALARRRTHVGLDGIAWSGLPAGRWRWTDLEQVLDVRLNGTRPVALRVRARGRERPVTVPLPLFSTPFAHALASHVRSVVRFSAEEPDAIPDDELEAYRGPAFPEALLRDVLEAPASTEDARLAAARRLLRDGLLGHGELMRLAEQVVSPELREGLRGAGRTVRT